MGEHVTQSVAIQCVEAALEGASEVYVAVVHADGRADVYAGKHRPNGGVNIAHVSTRGLKLGQLLDELHGPLVAMAAHQRMSAYDHYPEDVRALIQEHGPRVARAYEEGYGAQEIEILLKAGAI